MGDSIKNVWQNTPEIDFAKLGGFKVQIPLILGPALWDRV